MVLRKTSYLNFLALYSNEILVTAGPFFRCSFGLPVNVKPTDKTKEVRILFVIAETKEKIDWNMN